MFEHFQVFDEIYNDQELSNEFHKFFYTNNLLSLFTNEHRAGTIRVTYVDARSVVNPGGQYHQLLLDFSDILAIGSDNKMLEEATFKILYEARTFQRMMNIIRTLVNYYRTIDPEDIDNFWNIVFYNKQLF